MQSKIQNYHPEPGEGRKSKISPGLRPLGSPSTPSLGTRSEPRGEEGDEEQNRTPTRWVGRKLLALVGGALSGYVVGWILGWSAFDPNSDLWALGGMVGGLAGLAAGATPWFRRQAGLVLGAALGAYLGWLLRTLLFGDVPGGPGLILVGLGLAAGALAGSRPAFRPGTRGRRVLAALLAGGMAGGFILDVLLLDLLLGLVEEHSILEQAPWVLACGILAGAMAARARPAIPGSQTP